eukprot:2787197-Pyramimonas_sp.AAC.1
MYARAVGFPWRAFERGHSCTQDRGGRACTYVVARSIVWPVSTLLFLRMGLGSSRGDALAQECSSAARSSRRPVVDVEICHRPTAVGPPW